MPLDLTFGWQERAAIYRRRRTKRWRRLGAGALLALTAAVLWYALHWAAWLLSTE